MLGDSNQFSWTHSHQVQSKPSLPTPSHHATSLLVAIAAIATTAPARTTAIATAAIAAAASTAPVVLLTPAALLRPLTIALMKRQVPKHQHHVFNSIQTMHSVHANAWNHKKAEQNIPTSLTRAATPSLDLRVAKSDFKRSNLILSAVYMVLRHNLISRKHAPEQLSSTISCRDSDVVHYKQICEKHLCSNYIQMLRR